MILNNFNLRDNETGKTYRAIDFRPFMKVSFEKVIPDLYRDLNNNDRAFQKLKDGILRFD